MKRYEDISWQLQQRVNIHFCVKLGFKFQQIKHSLRQCYGRILSDATIFFWMKEFKGGRTRIVDKPRAHKARKGHCQENQRRIEDLVTADCHITIRQLSIQSSIPFTTVQRILKFDLKLTKKCAKFVPYDLTERHIEQRKQICDFWGRLARANPRVFRHVVTMDESWIYIYDPELKCQSKTWLRAGEQRPQKPRRTLATAKVMIVTFFDCRGMIYYEYVQHPQTVNQIYFRGIMTRFTAAFHRRRPRSSVQGRHFKHMDNAPAHNATLTLQHVQQLGWTSLPQPACSPDLAPCDFFLYPRIKCQIRGHKFNNLQELKDAVSDQVAEITADEYRRCILQTWPKRWAKCLQYNSQYFEGMP